MNKSKSNAFTVTGTATAPLVTSITPTVALAEATVDVTNLAGDRFASGAIARLTRLGQSPITATQVTVLSPSRITCTLNLPGAAPGFWNIEVIGPNAQVGHLTDGFEIREEQSVYGPLIMHGYATLPPQLYPTGDTTVLQGAASYNFADTIDTWVGYDHCEPAQVGRSLIQFDVSAIPPGQTLSQATLRLYLTDSCDIGERTHTVTAYRVTSGWSAGSVTWNSQPGYGEAYGFRAIPSRTWGWYTFDVTSLVQGWVNGSYPNYGLVLRGPESSGDSSARLGFRTEDNLLALGPSG